MKPWVLILLLSAPAWSESIYNPDDTRTYYVEVGSDICHRVVVSHGSDRIDALLNALNATVWTEDEWKKVSADRMKPDEQKFIDDGKKDLDQMNPEKNP